MTQAAISPLAAIDWLDAIPEHWDLKKFKFLGRFRGGGTPSKDNQDFWKGSIPWVSPKDMKVSLVSDTIDHITEDAVAASSTSILPPDSLLLVVRSGILQHTIPIATNSVPVALNQDMKAFAPAKNIRTDYLRYLIHGSQHQLLVLWRKVGATVESLEAEYVVNTLIPVPPVLEQQTIADFLDRKTAEIDGLIAKKQRLIDLLGDKRQALISHAVTKGLNPAAPMKDSGIEWLGEVPDHWDVVQLKRALQSSDYGISDSLSQEGEIGVLRMGDIRHGEIILDDLRYVDAVPKELLLDTNDLLFNRTNSLEQIAKVGIFRGSIEDQISFASYLVRLRANEKAVPQYLNYLLNAPPCIAFARGLALPSINQANLNPSRFGSMEVPLPPVEDQSKIVEFLDDQCGRLNQLSKKVSFHIEKLQEYRQTLISAAVTGKLDVTKEATC